ncbi:transposase [Azospirillaceae bacterium]
MAGINVRRDITSTVLKKKAREEKDGSLSIRMLGIAHVLDGMDRQTAAKTVGVSRQTLRDWIIRYNAKGIDGLRDIPKGHPKRELSVEQEKELSDIILNGPPKEGNLVRWRRIDLKRLIEEKFGVSYHERTIGKILHRLGFSHISVRSIHPKTNIKSQEEFKDNFFSYIK